MLPSICGLFVRLRIDELRAHRWGSFFLSGSVVFLLEGLEDVRLFE